MPAATGKTVFSPEFRLADAGGVPNFLGPFAPGPRQERFFYLSWGEGDTGSTFAMFRRLKVHLSHLTWRDIRAAEKRARSLKVILKMTDACGGPRCASVWPGDLGVTWN